MRTSNPALRENTFRDAAQANTGEVMTLDGAVHKTGILLLLTVMAAVFGWTHPAASAAYIMVGAVGGFIVALITVFKKEWSPVTAPVYALLEGVFLGCLSMVFEKQYPGIVKQAVALTFGTLFCLLVAYRGRLIQATENFKLGVFAATGAIALFYLLAFVLGFFNIQMPLLHSTGWIGIGFSLFVVVIAALNLVLDFDFIEQGVACGAPRYMEWYAGFGLLVTLVWLYLEILRLLAKLNDRR